MGRVILDRVVREGLAEKVTFNLDLKVEKEIELCKELAKGRGRASLVAHWLRTHLPKQGTRVRALVWEDPTCCRATKPMGHNY